MDIGRMEQKMVTTIMGYSYPQPLNLKPKLYRAYLQRSELLDLDGLSSLAIVFPSRTSLRIVDCLFHDPKSKAETVQGLGYPKP